jgi:SAM-dependent methyltransferase
MVSFFCNVCGAQNHVEAFATEPSSCSCGSNVRIRALIHLLSMELFGQSIPLTEFPKIRSIRGLGMTDQQGYAEILAEKFDYTNTYYDREPRFDFTEFHPQLAGTYDFILSADVLEHIAPPVERALAEVCQLLRPRGFFGITVYCNPADVMREHYPELHDYSVVPLGDSTLLINRRRDGTLEIHENLTFHGGSGSTLEMREFGITELKAKLLAAGFLDVHLFKGNVPESGILFDHDVSQPMIARKQPFAMDLHAHYQLVELWRKAQAQVRQKQDEANRLNIQMRLASESRWVRLGRKLGVGPKFGES